jgi:hypothetical protein
MRVGVNPCCEPRNPYAIVSAAVKQTLQRVNVQER